MSVYELFKSKGPSGFGYGSTAEEVTAGLSLVGKTMLVTGCNSGLGQETMRVLALRVQHGKGAEAGAHADRHRRRDLGLEPRDHGQAQGAGVRSFGGVAVVAVAGAEQRPVGEKSVTGKLAPIQLRRAQAA